jgi:hypothetical protein
VISKRLVQVIRGLLFLNKISNSNLINKTDHCQEILPQINTFKRALLGTKNISREWSESRARRRG